MQGALNVFIEVNIIKMYFGYSIQGGMDMKHIRKFFQTVMVMAFAICLTSMPVMAQEQSDYNVVQQKNEAVTYASIPSGYTLVAAYSRTPQTYYLGTTSVRSTSTFQLYLPNENRQDWIQGKVTFTPVGGGTATEFAFTNLSGEYKTFNLSELTSGTYQVRVYAYAFGTSNKAAAYYRMNY